MQEKSENFNSLRPILFELCKKTTGGVKLTPPPAGIGLKKYDVIVKIPINFCVRDCNLFAKLRYTFTERTIFNHSLKIQVLFTLSSFMLIQLISMIQGYPSRAQFSELYNMYKQYLPPDLARYIMFIQFYIMYKQYLPPNLAMYLLFIYLYNMYKQYIPPNTQLGNRYLVHNMKL